MFNLQFHLSLHKSEVQLFSHIQKLCTDFVFVFLFSLSPVTDMKFDV